MESNKDIRKNRMQRHKQREKNKKIRKIKLISLGMVAIMTISVAFLWAFSEKKANADIARILPSEEQTDSSSKKVEKKEIIKDFKYSDKVYKYKRVIVDTAIYNVVNQDSEVNLKLKSGEYVEFMGSEDNWSKIKYKNSIGYVEDSNLADVKDDELKVVDGILLTSKKYGIPKDYETKFDIETEDALIVMLEAMKREGLDIEVSKKSLDEEDVKKDSSKTKPDFIHNTLRTGRAVELIVPNNIVNIKFKDTPQFKWLIENSYKYGFILRYPEGKEEITGYEANNQIFRYIGIEKAKNLYNNKLTIEEFFGI